MKSRRGVVCLGVIGWVVGQGGWAQASPKAADREALREAEVAVREEHAGGRHDEARRRLEAALSKCREVCEGSTQAQLHRDLGVVLAALGQREQAQDAFRRALKADPGIELDDASATVAVWKLWTVAAVEASGKAPADAGSKAAPGAVKASDAPPAAGGARRAWWLGLAAQLEALPMRSQEACSRASQQSVQFQCFRADGEPYLGSPQAEDAGVVDETLVAGTARVLLSAEAELSPSLTLGGRLGYAFLGGPAPGRGPAFLPFHAEARATYWPLGGRSTGRLQPLVLASMAMAQIDARAAVQVVECRAGDVGCEPASGGQPGGKNPDAQQLDAYRRLGRGVAGLGVGGWLPLGEGSGLQLEVNLLLAFPTQGLALAPSLAYVVRVR